MIQAIQKMSGRKFGRLIIGGCLSLLPFIILPGAIAQELPNGNASDNTGTTVTEPTLETRDGDENFVDQDVLDAAERFSTQLGNARIACADSRVAAANLPRRFARGPVTQTVCVSQECQTLRVVTQQAKEFLQSLDQAQRDRLRQIQALQLW
ncbi:MAG: hypothetical protein HC781_00035 [Leptolyngbyaceae cyanobacterium CSU_1_4]|nr:hypothetical protein [Leptolyngbyaceae cyanobacterium CSU_1_4]